MKIDLTLLKKIHHSISLGATGSPDILAKKLGISKRLLLAILKLLREEFGSPIEYSRIKKTYYYTEECDFYFGIVRNRRMAITQAVLTAIDSVISKPTEL